MTSIPIPAEDRWRRRGRNRGRWMAAGLALSLHLAILALFLSSHPRMTVGKGVGAGTMDVAVEGFSRGSAPSKTPAAPATPAPLAPPAPVAEADPIKPRSVLAIVSDILAIPLPEQSVTPTPLVPPTPSPVMARAIAQASGASGAACDIGGAIQTVLRADPAAHAAMLLTPAKTRSAANAVLMWNGQWAAPADVGGAPAYDVLRGSVRQVVVAARPDCRDQAMVGPTFMLIPDGDATMVVVFGNASWRWSDLLADPAEAPSSDSVPSEKKVVPAGHQ